MSLAYAKQERRSLLEVGVMPATLPQKTMWPHLRKAWPWHGLTRDDVVTGAMVVRQRIAARRKRGR